MTAPATPVAPIQNTDPDQYQTPDPIAPQTPAQGAPLTSAQNPTGAQDPSVQVQNPGVAQNVGPAQPAQPAPAASMQTPPVPMTRTQRLLQTARHISEAMTPGPLYKTTINDDGTTTRTAAPVSARSIGLAIALEALSSGLAGAGERGPNAIGQAAQVGLQQGEKIAQQHQAQQTQLDQQAQQDLRTKQQVITNLLQTRQLAMTLGRQSLADATESVKADADAWAEHQEDPSSILASGLTHDDVYKKLTELGMGNAQVLITGAHPRRDPQTGEPLYQMPNGQIVPQGTPGSYIAPDFTYALVKPDAKVSPVGDDGRWKPQYQAAANRGYIAVNGASTDRLPTNFTMTSVASQAALRGSQTANEVQADVDQSREQLGLKPLNIDLDLKGDPAVRSALTIYNAVLNQGGTHAQAMQAVAQSKYATAAGTINNWYGGRQNTALLDQRADAIRFDNGILYGHAPIVTRADADRAAASTNPKVAAAGKAAQTRMDQEAAQTKRVAAQATEGVHVAGEEQLARFKENLAASGVGPDSPAANAAPNAQGVNTTYLASLPATTRNFLTAVAEGRKTMPNRGTKDGIELAKMLTTAYPDYDENKGRAYAPTLTKFESGKEGQQVNALNTAISHIESGYDALNKISGLGTLPVIGAAERFFGNKDAAMLSDAKKVMVDEVNNAWSSKALTQEERNSLEKQINSASPIELKNHFVDFTKLLGTKMANLQQQLDDARPSQAIQRKQLMRNGTLAAYRKITREDPDEVLLVNRGANTQGAHQQQVLTNFQTNPQTGQRIGWNGTAWVDANTLQPVGGR